MRFIKFQGVLGHTAMSPLGNFLKESHLLSDSEEITAPKSPSSELQCLSSLLLKMGNDPSVNLIEILEFGPKFLCCKRINYLDHTSENHLSVCNEDSVHLPLTEYGKCLVLHGVNGPLNPENLKIFTALITQQEKRLEDSIKVKSLQQYSRTLLEACPDGILVTDNSGHIISANRTMVAMTGKPLEALLGMRATQLSTKESRSEAFQALRRLQTHSKSRFNCEIQVSATRSIPVSVSFSYCEFENETLILATVRDLSYLTEEIQKVNSYEESLASTIEKASDGFVLYNEFGRIVEVNPHVEKLTGVPANRLVGRPVEDLLTAGSMRSFRKAIGSLQNTGYTSFNSSIFHSDGTAMPAKCTLMRFTQNGERFCRLMIQEHKMLCPQVVNSL